MMMCPEMINHIILYLIPLRCRQINKYYYNVSMVDIIKKYNIGYEDAIGSLNNIQMCKCLYDMGIVVPKEIFVIILQGYANIDVCKFAHSIDARLYSEYRQPNMKHCSLSTYKFLYSINIRTNSWDLDTCIVNKKICMS